MTNQQNFRDRHVYDREKFGYVGIEREGILEQVSLLKELLGMKYERRIVPHAAEVLHLVHTKGVPLPLVKTFSWYGLDIGTTYLKSKREEFSYELSACQIETRIGPCKLENLEKELLENDRRLRLLLQAFNLTPSFAEVAPETMPLDVYPDPSGRYARIASSLTHEQLLAACRVIGTHIHIGMPSHETALEVYNRVIRKTNELCEMGNGSYGERLRIYRTMAPACNPPSYPSWSAYEEAARAQGFYEDPRACWTLIRMSVHGTIEFRMFGATDSIPRIVEWATVCHKLCMDAYREAREDNLNRRCFG